MEACWCLGGYVVHLDLALLTWLPGLVLDQSCQYRFAWMSPGSQVTRVTVTALFCSPCLRAVRWGRVREYPTPPASLSSQAPGASALAGKPHSYSTWTMLSSGLKIIFVLLCTVNRINNCSGIKPLWWPISSRTPDLNGFPTFRIGDLVEVTVHNLENPLQYGNGM